MTSEEFKKLDRDGQESQAKVDKVIHDLGNDPYLCKRLKNYPGWEKGKRIQLKNGFTVKVISHGIYVPAKKSGFWQYEVKFPSGQIRIWVPQIGDKILDGI